MSKLVRVSEDTYNKMKVEKPPNMTQVQYFDLLVENQSRIMEVQEEILKKLDVILKKLSANCEEPVTENPKDFLQEIFSKEGI